MTLFEQALTENNIKHLIKAYTLNEPFSATLNRHFAANILFYFGHTLDDNVDYELVKCVVDFVSLIMYREELREYLFSGTIFRGVAMSAEDFTKFIVGSQVMNTTFLSATRDKEVADIFSGNGQHEFPVLFTFKIHNKNGRRTALNIESLSHFPSEQEVLILPFSAFYVESVMQPTNNLNPIEVTLVELD